MKKEKKKKKILDLNNISFVLGCRHATGALAP